MARLVTAGFETGSVQELNGAYNGVAARTTYPRTGSYALTFEGSGLTGAYHNEVFSANKTTIFGRMAFCFTAALMSECLTSGKNAPLLVFYDENGTPNLALELSPNTQTFVLRRGDPHTGTIIANGYIVVQANAYYVLEWKATIDNTTGEFISKINSVTDIAFTGDTQEGGAHTRRVRFASHDWLLTLQDYLYLDDIGINDDSGTYQNSWLGLGGVYLLKPDSEGDTQEWTPSAGTTHWDKVDDVPANTTDWVQAGTAALELFNLESCPENIADIDLVQVVFQSAVVSSGSQDLVDVVRQGTVDYDGGTVTEVSLADTYLLHWGTPHYVQPNGSGAWGTAEVNDLQIGVRIP